MSEKPSTFPSQAQPADPRRVPLRIVLPVVLVCVYTPYSWLLWDYPWNDTRIHWIVRWPLLPGLVPGYLMDQATESGSNTLLWSVAGVCSFVFIAFLVLLGRGSRWRLVIAALLAVAISIPCSLAANSAYRF